MEEVKRGRRRGEGKANDMQAPAHSVCMLTVLIALHAYSPCLLHKTARVCYALVLSLPCPHKAARVPRVSPRPARTRLARAPCVSSSSTPYVHSPQRVCPTRTDPLCTYKSAWVPRVSCPPSPALTRLHVCTACIHPLPAAHNVRGGGYVGGQASSEEAATADARWAEMTRRKKANSRKRLRDSSRAGGERPPRRLATSADGTAASNGPPVAGVPPEFSGTEPHDGGTCQRVQHRLLPASDVEVLLEVSLLQWRLSCVLLAV